MPRSTVLLVDDHEIVRKGVRAVLEGEEDFEVVGEASSGQEAVARARDTHPDLILLDITLGDVNGLEVMGRIKEAAPNAGVVVLTMHEDKDYFFRSLQAGAVGYVIKGWPSDHIVAALRAVREGGVYLHPVLAKSIVSEYVGAGGSPAIPSLSAREMEVLRLIGEGLANKEIASRMGISMTTAQTYRTRMMEKLGLHTVAELTRYGVSKGIIKP